MIVVTRLNLSRFAVNPDLIERVQASPDTTIVMVDGARFVVRETMDELIAQITAFRASVLAQASRLASARQAEGL
ncbi:flagellar FlbD family protein [Microbacterium sp. NPDC089321]|uniref:flagellar FlbD family protein n=1 Tax=Microbacterium sp. NPDC089321 TaxID=3155183 RepID=UPI0034240ED0